METLVRSATLNGFVAVARSVGLDPHALIREVGLDPAALVNTDVRLRVNKVCELMDMAASRANCPSLGLQMTLQRHALDFGLLGVLMAHKRSLRDMWQTAIEYHYLANDALTIGLDVQGQVAVLRHELMVDTPAPLVQATELSAGVIVRSCQAVLGPTWHPRSVQFVHPAPADTQWHRQVFGCPLQFGGEMNEVVLSVADLDAANPSADPALVRYAESLARPQNATAPDIALQEVRQAVFMLLPIDGGASIERVATHLHVSVRTLQRRLDHAGSSFSSEVNAVRRDLVQRYMKNPKYTLGHIAALLGYTRQGSFTRWFIDQFGVAPKDWRARTAA